MGGQQSRTLSLKREMNAVYSKTVLLSAAGEGELSPGSEKGGKSTGGHGET